MFLPIIDYGPIKILYILFKSAHNSEGHEREIIMNMVNKHDRNIQGRQVLCPSFA